MLFIFVTGGFVIKMVIYTNLNKFQINLNLNKFKYFHSQVTLCTVGQRPIKLGYVRTKNLGPLLDLYCPMLNYCSAILGPFFYTIAFKKFRFTACKFNNIH